MTSNGLNTSYPIPHTSYPIPRIRFAIRFSPFALRRGHWVLFLSSSPYPGTSYPATSYLAPRDLIARRDLNVN